MISKYRLAFLLLVVTLFAWGQSNSPAPKKETDAEEQSSQVAVVEMPRQKSVQQSDPEMQTISLPPEVRRALRHIDGAQIVEIARTLSSPEYMGRKTSSKGARLSAVYIDEQFRDIGLLPGGSAGSYFRPFKIYFGYKFSGELQALLGKDSIAHFHRGEDYMPIHLVDRKAEVEAECVLVGYGITAPQLGFDEYKGLDVEGKAVIVFSGAPWSPQVREWLQQGPETGMFDSIHYKVKNAEKHGASCVFIVDNPVGWRQELQVTERLKLLDLNFPFESSIPVVHVTRKFLSAVTMMSVEELRLLALGICRSRSPQPMLLPECKMRFRSSIAGDAWIGRNIIGILPGRDPKLKHEAVVIGAHYDHLGEKESDSIYFGANDNAAGVGAIILIAKAFSQLALPPRRTIVFVNFDAEEIGRIGSSNYVNSPAIPIDKTVLMINFDMIGRNDPNHIFAVGTPSSPQLHRIHVEANREIDLDITHPESFRLGRSDHTAFYYAGIPIMYLFGGKDPDYHSPRDTWDKLIPEKLEKVAQLAFLTAWQVSEREQRISFEEAQVK